MYFQEESAAITPSKRGQNNQQHSHAVSAHLIARANHRNPLVILQKLHAADRRGRSQQTSETTKCEAKPCGGKFLDQTRLVFLEEGENDDRAERRQPGDDGENVVS